MGFLYFIAATHTYIQRPHTFPFPAMTLGTITFAADPAQYGTNGYWKVNLKKSTKEYGTPGPMVPNCDTDGNCQFTMFPKGPAANPVTKTGTAENAPLPDYSSCANNGAKKAALFAGAGMTF